MKKNNDFDLNKRKNEINEKHIKFYDKTLYVLEFILDKYSKELKAANIGFLEMSKNSIAVMDFLISAIGKVQKGQRLALGIEEGTVEYSEPVINVIEGLSEEKI